MGRLIAQLIEAADNMADYLEGNNIAWWAAPYFEQPEVRSFAFLHTAELEQAGQEFNSRDIGPVF
jgi:hypothetical protein